VRAIGAQEVPRNLAADVVIGCVATPACDQSKVFATAPELIFRQMRFPMRSEKRICAGPAVARQERCCGSFENVAARVHSGLGMA
jgi:hypothetical protein